MARISKAQLIKLQKKFKTDAAIGEQFGITRQAVHQLRKKHGLDSSLAENPVRNADIIDAYKAGSSGTALAKKFKLSISQTYRIINEAQGTAKPAKKPVKKAAKPVKRVAVKKKAGPAVKKAAAPAKAPVAKKTVKPAKNAKKR